MEEWNSLVKDSGPATDGPWWVTENDLIGGWCVRTIGEPPSSGRGVTIAEFVRREDARLCVTARDLTMQTEAIAGIRAAQTPDIAIADDGTLYLNPRSSRLLLVGSSLPVTYVHIRQSWVHRTHDRRKRCIFIDSSSAPGIGSPSEFTHPYYQQFHGTVQFDGSVGEAIDRFFPEDRAAIQGFSSRDFLPTYAMCHHCGSAINTVLDDLNVCVLVIDGVPPKGALTWVHATCGPSEVIHPS